MFFAAIFIYLVELRPHLCGTVMVGKEAVASEAVASILHSQVCDGGLLLVKNVPT
jgi:hypothetical protein